jgi:hypothetical protein
MTVSRNVRVMAWASAMLLSLHFTAAWAEQRAQYNVTLDFKEPLRAIVQASLVVPDGKIFTHEHAGGYEWIDYITNLHAYKRDGSGIPLHQSDRGK